MGRARACNAQSRPVKQVQYLQPGRHQTNGISRRQHHLTVRAKLATVTPSKQLHQHNWKAEHTQNSCISSDTGTHRRPPVARPAVVDGHLHNRHVGRVRERGARLIRRLRSVRMVPSVTQAWRAENNQSVRLLSGGEVTLVAWQRQRGTHTPTCKPSLSLQPSSWEPALIYTRKVSRSSNVHRSRVVHRTACLEPPSSTAYSVQAKRSAY